MEERQCAQGLILLRKSSILLQVHVHTLADSLLLFLPSLPPFLLQHLTEKFIPDGMVKVTKMLDRRPPDWASCMALARVKFEKYFNHKVCMDIMLSSVQSCQY